MPAQRFAVAHFVDMILCVPMLFDMNIVPGSHFKHIGLERTEKLLALPSARIAPQLGEDVADLAPVGNISWMRTGDETGVSFGRPVLGRGARRVRFMARTASNPHKNNG